MATPKTTLWDPAPHTKAKHQMLQGHLGAWFPIIAQGFPSRGPTYVDAFAGPGEYTDGSSGSPVIALRHALRNDVAGRCDKVRLLFIEERTDRYKHLRSLVNADFPDLPPNLILRTVNGSYEQNLLPELIKIRGLAGPLFVNFDGWGTDTRYNIVRTIAAQRSAEVLVTFSSQHFIRFAKLEDRPEGDLVFGTSTWREIASSGSPAEKKRRLLDLYRSQLANAGLPYSLIFELVGAGGNDLLLVFGTQSLDGVGKMKESMWNVDPSYGQRFRDPRDVNQLTMSFGTDPDLTLLRRQILVRLERGEQSLAALKQYTLTDTIFKPTHAPVAVRTLEEAGDVEVERSRSHADTIVRLAPPRLFPM